jgi:hypothetical protein
MSSKVKDPAAVSLGRRGGLAGAGAYLNSLSPAELKEHQQKAAAARWGNSRKKSGAKAAKRLKERAK